MTDVGSPSREPWVDEPRLHGFLWSAGGGLTDLPPLGADIHSVAFAVADSAASVGISYVLGQLSVTAVRWGQAGTTPLGSFVARAMSPNGLVAGEMPTNPFSAFAHAALYQQGTLTDLGTLGGQFSSAYGVSGSGQVVGMATNVEEVPRAFLCSSTPGRVRPAVRSPCSSWPSTVCRSCASPCSMSSMVRASGP